MSRGLWGLYAITPERSASGAHSLQSLIDAVAQAIRGGARAIQYRDKGADWGRRWAEASALLTLCRASCVPLIVNDDLDLALAVGADGVHLGRDDADPRAARQRLGPRAIIGLSCYDQLERGIEAERRGASYVAFGSFFPSPSKPNAPRPEPRLLSQARRVLRLPLVAIGGITPQNAGPLLAAGADMVAVITGVFSSADITAAAQAYSRLFLGPRHPTEDPQ